MHSLPFCAVAGFVPENKFVELLLKSSKDLYSILCSLQLSGIFMLKNSKWQDTILVLSYSILSHFFSFLYFLCWNSSLPGPPCLQRRRGRINLEILAFVFQILNSRGRRKSVSPRKVTLISMAGKGFPKIRNIPQGPGLYIERDMQCLLPCILVVLLERQGDLWKSWGLRAKGMKVWPPAARPRRSRLYRFSTRVINMWPCSKWVNMIMRFGVV